MRLVLGLIVFLSANAWSVSAAEAEAFCLKQWFPKLRAGKVLSPTEMEAALDDLMEIYTDQVEFIDPNNQDSFGKSVLVGKAEVRRYYRAILKNYPLWEFSILELHETDRGFVLRYEGRNAPPVARFEGVDLIELESGPAGFKISKLKGYYDRKPFLPPGG